ncbi:MAG: 30S ribosomal protein S18 [Chloroflexi bacterium]|nr:30S ribosomal protein S18 [Chloroflexota bacterium]
MTTSRYGSSDREYRSGGAGPSAGGKPGAGGPPARGRRPWGRRKVCVFCAEKIEPEYKGVNRLRRFLNDRSRIESGKKTGTCAKHQRVLRREIKRARFLGLLPFVADHLRVTGPATVPGARAAAAEAEAGAEEVAPEEALEAVEPIEESETEVGSVEPAGDQNPQV